MPLNNRFKKPNLSDLGQFNFGRLAEDILGVVMNVQSEGKSRVKSEIEKLLERLDLVTRREFDAVREIAIAARQQAEALAEQINGGKKPAAKKTAVKKAPAKKAPAKKLAKKTTAKRR